MQNHHHRIQKFRSVAEYLLIFVIVFVSASFFFRAKDNADADYLEKVSKKATETDGVADKSRTTVISINMHTQPIDAADFPEINDMEPSRETHILWKIVLLSLVGLGIIVIIVKRGGENEKHHKSK